MRGLRSVLAVGTFLFAGILPAFAQQGTSEIGGKITDAQGGVLPGVAIVVTNEDTGLFREVVTGPGGSYFVSQMIPGRYRITAKLDGFKALDRRGIVLTVGQTTTLDLILEVGTWPKRSRSRAKRRSSISRPPKSAVTSRPTSCRSCRRPIATTCRLSATCRARSSCRAASSSTTASRPTGSRPRPTRSSSTARTTPTSSAARTSAARRAPPTSRFRKCRS